MVWQKFEHKKTGPIFRSQFSMGQLDFERYDKLLAQADEYGVQVENKNFEAIRPFYSVLKQFYRQIKFIVRDRDRLEELSKRIENRLAMVESEKKIRHPIEHMIGPLLEDLNTFADEVYAIKQFVGLGIEVEKVLSRKQMWERAARIGG